jgi:hypothetical protein
MLRLAVVVLVCLFAASGRVTAAEPYLQFLQALRDGGQDEHFEAAYAYLDQIEKRQDLPKDVRDVLDYERGLTLSTQATRQTSVELQRRLIADSETALTKFAREHSNHPLAGEANFQRAALILKKAQVEVFAALDPTNSASRPDLQARARKFSDEARDAFKTSSKQLKIELDKFPEQIDPDDVKQLQAKRRVEGPYFQSQYQAAMSVYLDAQSYRDPESDTQPQIFKSKVKDASDEFEKVFEKFRQQLIGRYARLMQGKCLEELDDLRPALGIYDDIIDNLEGGEPGREALKDKALQFRLGLMNHPTRKETDQVIERANAWMTKNKDRVRTDAGFGITYELAIALKDEALADGTTPSKKSANLARAYDLATTLAKSSVETRTKGVLLQKELAGLRNRKVGPVRTFGEAITEADLLRADLRPLQDAHVGAMAEGTAADVSEKKKALSEQADKLVKIYDQALLLADASTDPVQVGSARRQLALAYYLQDKYLEAATVADYQVQKFSAGPLADSARDAAYIAAVSMEVLYRRAPRDDRDFERKTLEKAANIIITRWPDSERANDARLMLGSVSFDNGEYLAAIDRWKQIKGTAGPFGAAQVKIGQAYWLHYATEASKDDKERPSANELNEWESAAEKSLEAGIAALSQGASTVTPPTELFLGKLGLSVIRNQNGVYKSQGSQKGAYELLTDEPFSVIGAVEIPQGQKRPRDPSNPRSRQMASYAYQQLLKTCIGLKDIDKAQSARMKLEEIASEGGGDAEALTQIFVEFGKELQAQLNQLRAQGDALRLAEVREGFESFLNDIQNRSEGHNWNTRLWIAETFSSLGDSADHTPDIARGYYDRAAKSYQQMLDDAKQAPSPDHLASCRLQLGKTQAKTNQFKTAEENILEVIKQKNSVGAQLAAADLYRDWGESEETDAHKNYLLAISGQKSPIEIWGYGRISQDVQKQMLQEADETKRNALDRLRIDTRYDLAKCLRELGMVQPTNDDRTKTLNQAATAIIPLSKAKLTKGDYERFNRLFEEVQTDLGLVAVELKDADKVVLVDPTKPRKVAAAADVPVTPEGTIPTSKANVAVIAALLLAGLGAIGGILFYANQQQKAQLRKLSELAAGSDPSAKPRGRSRPDT